MADHFARAAGFAGDETTEASVMPRRIPDMTLDETQATGQMLPPLPSQQPSQQQGRAQRIPSQILLPPPGERVSSHQSTTTENRSAVGAMTNVNKGKTGSIRVPASRVPLQPSNSQTGSSTSDSRPTSSQAVNRNSAPARSPAEEGREDYNLLDGSGPEDDDDQEGDSSDEIFNRPNPNMTVANETTIASADNSEWHRHAKEHQATAGIGMKSLQRRIADLTQEREDLKIEVDILRRNYRPDENMAELIRLRQESVKSYKMNDVLKKIAEQQRTAIKQLNKELNALKKQQATGAGESELRKRMSDMEETMRLLDQQREEEAAARRRAEDEAQRGNEELAKLEQEHTGLLDKFEDVDRQREDLEGDIYRLEKERDEVAEERGRWQQQAQEFEAQVAELEQQANDREAQLAVQSESGHREDLQNLEAELESRTEDLQRTQQELQEVRGQLETTISEAAVFKGEVEAQRAAEEETYNELRDQLSAKTNELLQLEEDHEQLLDARKADEEELVQLEARCDELQRIAEEKEREILDCNQDIARLSEANRRLEEEQELSVADANEADAVRGQVEEDMMAQKEHYDMKIEGLKTRLADAATELADAHERLGIAEEDVENLKAKLDQYRERVKQRTQDLEDATSTNAKLDEKVQDLLADLKDEERNRELDAGEWEKRMNDLEDDLRRLIDEKEDALAGAEDDITSLQQTLKDRDTDLQALQQALRAKESESGHLDRTSSAERHSLQLEIDRLKRDLSRCEAELARNRDELDRKDDLLRERTNQMNKVYGESSEHAAKLATETQKRLGLEERIATLKKSLRETEHALDTAQARADELERQKTDEDTSLARIEGSSKRQIQERNQLLTLVAQHMAKILHNDDGTSTSRSKHKADSELKPSTDFGAFHGLLIDRIRRLADLKSGFERRTMKMQGAFAETFSQIKKQQESRGRQIDRLEVSLKAAADKQNQWRSRVVAKQAELEAAKGTVTELQSQISSLKTRTSLASPGDNSKLTSLTSRANLAEKKMQAALKEVQLAEERLGEAKTKYSEGESKWMARIRELEVRCKAAEEKVKRERQGAKERVAEQQEQRRKLEQDVHAAQRRLKTVGNLHADLEGID